MTSLRWAPTIALSWLWGLGFFFSFHVTLAYGWAGFIAFAIPNAFGLFAFGWLLGRPGCNAAAVFERVRTRYLMLFLASQILAVGITLFAAQAYLFGPAFGSNAYLAIVVVLVVGIVVGHVSTIGGLRTLHVIYLAVGVAAAFCVLALLWRTGRPSDVPLITFDRRFYGLLIPSLVGFLVGPWTDVQHWQRVVAIEAGGGSVRRAYAGGALLFLGLISLNALLAAFAGPALVVVASDGLRSLQAAVTGATLREGGGLALAAFVVWTGIAVVSTLDSFTTATRWLLRDALRGAVGRTAPAVATSPLWVLALAFGAVAAHVPMIVLMLPYATLFAGSAACLVFEVLGGAPLHNGAFCALIGLAAYIEFVVGHYAGNPYLTSSAPILGLAGAAAAARAWLKRRQSRAGTAPPQDIGPIRTVGGRTES